MIANPTRDAPNIGKLCMCGDWACAHGDFGGLRDVASQLSETSDELIDGSTHDALVELADACISQPERAAQLWPRLKSLLAAPPAH